MKRLNKVRNVGVLFESINKNVIESIKNDDIGRATKYFKLIKEFFLNKEKELHKAYKIHSQIIYGECTNAFYANRYMNYVFKETQKKIDTIKLNEEINQLIREVKNFSTPKKTFSIKIPNYKLHMSFQHLLEEKKRNLALTSSDRIKFEKTIIDHLMYNKETKKLRQNLSEQTAPKDKQNQILDQYTFLFALKEFNEHYKHSLSETQKHVLYKYLSTPSQKTFNRWMEKRINKIVNEISSRKTVVEDQKIQEKLDLVVEKLNAFNQVEDKVKNLTDILLSFDVVEQLKNIGEK